MTIARRKFITLLGGAAVAWPVAARAQQRTLPVIGWIAIGTPATGASMVAAVRKGLAEMGIVEGRNVEIEVRWTQNDFSRLLELAAELVRLRVAVILTGSPPAVRAAKAATSTIPIVFIMGEDPVKEGLVASLNRPGGNATGFSDFANQLAGKRLGLLHDAVPKATTMALLVNPTNPNAEPDTKDMQAAAAARRVDLQVLTAGSEADFEPAFAAMARQRVGALIVNTDPYFVGSQRERIVALAAQHAIPTLYDRREYVAAGGLLSYGPDRADALRQSATYVGRILKGEKPADLPVQQVTKLEFFINLKTAKALGLDIPSGVLAIVDEVIE
jgi:putative tryptophan/tyrosine transport system substrate-binding protein